MDHRYSDWRQEFSFFFFGTKFLWKDGLACFPNCLTLRLSEVAVSLCGGSITQHIKHLCHLFGFVLRYFCLSWIHRNSRRWAYWLLCCSCRSPTLLTWLAKQALSQTLAFWSLLQRAALSTFCINQCSSPRVALWVSPTPSALASGKHFFLKTGLWWLKHGCAMGTGNNCVYVSATHLL